MAGLTKSAVVRFSDTNRIYVSHVNNIQHFYPKHSKDFNSHKTDYQVKWEKSLVGDDGNHSGRYPAEILLLGVSDDEVKLKFKVKFPKLKISGTLPNLAKRPTTSQQGVNEGRRPRNTGSSKESTPVVKVTSKSSTDQHGTAGLKRKSREPQVTDGRTATSPPRGQPSKPSANTPAGTSKSAADKGVIQNGEPTELDNEALRRQNAMLQLQLSRLRKGPIQDEEAGSFIDDDSMDLSENPPNSRNAISDSEDGRNREKSPSRQGENSPTPDDDLSEESSDETVAARILKDLKGEELLEVKDGKVYIGKKCSMKAKMWQLKVRTSKDESKFIRNLGHGLWGKKKLSKRSLTGKGRTGQEKRQATPRKVNCTLAAFKGYMQSKNIPEAAEAALLREARKNLGQKMGDCARDSDPQYRAKVKEWNSNRKIRTQQARLQQAAEASVTSSSSDDDDQL